MEEFLENCEALIKIIHRLRGPGGCPWDIEQTPFTMRESILEEAHECIDAITEFSEGSSAGLENANARHACEELGDLLFNVLMVSYMFEQAGHFSINDVVSGVAEKIVRRHPHVFGETQGFAGPESENKASTARDVLNQWDKIKQSVEHREGESILESIPKGFPALMRAYKMQKKVGKVGFDFASADEVRKKLDEELQELDEALKTSTVPENKTSADKEGRAKIEEEMGDVFFSLVNLARLLGINPELALNSSNSKFEKRFKFVEQAMHEKNLKLDSSNLDTMNELWEKAKLNN